MNDGFSNNPCELSDSQPGRRSPNCAAVDDAITQEHLREPFTLNPSSGADSGSPEQASASGKGYLGVSFDEVNRVVKRQGFIGVICLERTRVGWELIKIFVGRQGDLISVPELRNRWGKIGRADNPSDSSIYDAICDLKKILKKLGLTIYSAPGTGYRLAELPPKGEANDPSPAFRPDQMV